MFMTFHGNLFTPSVNNTSEPCTVPVFTAPVLTNGARECTFASKITPKFTGHDYGRLMGIGCASSST